MCAAFLPQGRTPGTTEGSTFCPGSAGPILPTDFDGDDGSGPMVVRGVHLRADARRRGRRRRWSAWSDELDFEVLRRLSVSRRRAAPSGHTARRTHRGAGMPGFGSWASEWWKPVLFVIVAGHLTNVCVTLFLHRAQTHRSVRFHYLAALPMRIWLWLSTAIVTKEWVACHRKQHASADRDGDPHCPLREG